MINNIKVVAFDFDGVIADTTRLKSELFLEMFIQHPKFEHVVQFEAIHKSLPRAEKLKKLLPEIDGQATDQNLNHYLTQYKNLLDAKLYSAGLILGVRDFFDFLNLRQLPIYIVSAALKDEIEKYLLLHHLRIETEKIFDAKSAKSESLKCISEKEQVRLSEILFIGDQLSDYKAACEVQCQFLGISNDKIFPKQVIVKENFIFSHDEVLQEVLKDLGQNPHKY